MSAEELFDKILIETCSKHEEASEGKMMRSPGIKWNGKVIAFLHNNAMTFKLGIESDYFKHKYAGSEYLSPFKQKPPMKGWLTVPNDYIESWSAIMNECILLNDATG